MKTTLAERLREARKAADMTQKALGEAVGISQAAIQKIETGRAAQTTNLLPMLPVRLRHAADHFTEH